MAQDILITPGSGEPQILFRGSGTNDSAIELNVLSSYQSAGAGSGSALIFEGSQGQLFGITDNLSSGTIFSVSDITGLPTIEVNSDSQVKICEFGSGTLLYNDLIGNGTSRIHISGVHLGASGLRFNDATLQTTAFSTPVSVANGGTNATSFADKAVIITQDSGDDTLAAVAMDANGELLIGGTSGPAVATLTQGSNMSISNADGGITLASLAGADPSDEALKNNVQNLDINALDKVDELRPVEFDWNQIAFDEHDGKQGHDFGFIAQEVEQIFPELVSEWRGHKALNYGRLTVILLKAIQELRQEVETLKSTPN